MSLLGALLGRRGPSNVLPASGLRCLCSQLCRPPFKKQSELTGHPDSFFRSNPGTSKYIHEVKCVEYIAPRLDHFGFETVMPFEGASADIAVGVTGGMDTTRLVDIKSTTGGWRSVVSHSSRKWDVVTCLLVKLDPDSLEVQPDKAKLRLAGETCFREYTLDDALHAIMRSDVPTFHSQDALCFGLAMENQRSFISFQEISAFFASHGCSYDMYPVKNCKVDSILSMPGCEPCFVQEKTAYFVGRPAIWRGQACNLPLDQYAIGVDAFVVRARCPSSIARYAMMPNDAPLEWTGVFGYMEAVREGIQRFYAYPPPAQELAVKAGNNVRFNASHVFWIHDSWDDRLKSSMFEQVREMLLRNKELRRRCQ